MEKTEFHFIPNVGDVRKMFADYREQMQSLLIQSYAIETNVVNKLVELQSHMFQINRDIHDGKI